ncbi:uncharacterized protein QC763_507185 [Podospora pseudopauciseta]|uniref:Mid2 domain-containing protein n=1 Tax=Podospora pseudopauciseta TaxID=2093780 RepID=A0ABR0H9H8_9PEZI|nr:hypothetical protein QC763_507185 [Podospora pseudopauciseta]
MLLLTILGAVLPAAVTAMEFFTPPAFGTRGDFSKNPTYVELSTVDLHWSAPPKGLPYSVTLFQMNGTETMGQLEHVTRSVVGMTGWRWIVATTKDLDVSNMFMLIIFEEGTSNNLAMSHYFNISRRGEGVSNFQQPSETTTKLPTETTVILSPGLSTTTATSDGPGATSDAGGTTKDEFPNQQPAGASPTGLSTSAGIGIGVGATAVLAIGIAIGAYFLGRRRGGANAQAQNAEVAGPIAGSPGQGSGTLHSGASTQAVSPGAYHHAGQYPVEADYYSPKVEMDNRQYIPNTHVHEAFTNENRIELPAQGQQHTELSNRP